MGSITMIFKPSFAENQPCMTPQRQWNSSLPIQWCLLDPYGRVRVVDSCVLCPLGLSPTAMIHWQHCDCDVHYQTAKWQINTLHMQSRYLLWRITQLNQRRVLLSLWLDSFSSSVYYLSAFSSSFFVSHALIGGFRGLLHLFPLFSLYNCSLTNIVMIKTSPLKLLDPKLAFGCLEFRPSLSTLFMSYKILTRHSYLTMWRHVKKGVKRGGFRGGIRPKLEKVPPYETCA
jgi:hypothetical protein